MKTKFSFKWKLLTGIIAVTLFVFLLFRSVDQGLLNGAFRQWFVDKFMCVYNQQVDANHSITYETIDWYKFKYFLLNFSMFFLIILTILFVTSIHLYGRYCEKKSEEKTLSHLNDMIWTYRKAEADMEFFFPKQYQEIGAQILQMKTNMQRQEQILKEEAQKKNDLITYLAHDLKTPLTSVLGYLNLLEEAPDMPKAQKEKYIHIAYQKAERLEILIEQFFEITQFNLHSMILEKEPLDLSYMLMQMSEEFYPLLSSHQNTVDLQLDDTLMVYGDGDKLARVFNNILKNAVAYSYANSTITISGHCDKTMVQITFQNHGKTIPEQKLRMIFEKFFRSDDARRTNTGGAGLGLAIAKEIVELHQGSISASSKEEITTFQVCLPIRTGEEDYERN